MTKKNKKKTAREKRILVGAFLTAVVIAAGSTFAWFTSTDTVTNRLSANADYNVKIVESFAPPENWMPGEKVDKDVYAVNTGNIEAFAKATVSGMMSITREVPVQLDSISTPSSGNVTPDTWYGYSGDNQNSEPESSTPAGVSAIPAEGLTNGFEYPVPNGATHYLEQLDDTPIFLYYDDDEEGYCRLDGDLFDFNTSGFTVDNVKATGGASSVFVGGEVVPTPQGATHYVKNGDSYTFYKLVPGSGSAGGLNFTADGVYNCVELTENQVYAIEAGAFLAWAPSADTVNNVFGNKAIAFKEKNESDADTETKYWIKTNVDGDWIQVNETEYAQDTYDTSDIVARRTEGGSQPTNALKTEFKPHADGLYVFRRSIVVNTENSHAAGTETFEYEGYYFLGGKYYKVMNLDVTPDAKNDYEDGQYLDIAGDGTTKDGRLKSATACLVKEEKQYLEQPKSFEYDSALNRLIATYETNTESKLVGTDSNVDALAKALDEAEHNLVDAELFLERTLADKGIVNDAVKKESADVDTATKAYKDALAAYDAAVAQFKDALAEYNAGKSALESAKTAAKTALTALAGATGEVTSGGVTQADSAKDKDAWDGTNLTNNDNGVFKIKPDEGSFAYKYGVALKTYYDWANTYLTNNDGHVIYTYLTEVANTPDEGNKYEMTGDHSADGGINWTTVDKNNPEQVNALPKDKLVAELKYAANHMTYKFADSILNFTDNDSHKYHEYLMKLKVTEKHYNDALAAYNTAIANLNQAITALGPQGEFLNIENDTLVKESVISALDAWKSVKADNLKEKYTTLMGGENKNNEKTVTEYPVKTEEQVQNATTDLAGKEGELQTAWKTLKQEEKELDAVRNETYINPDGGLPYEGPRFDGSGNKTGLDDENVKGELERAWDEYYEARNIVDEAERRLKAAKKSFDGSGDLKIYIYLQNVSLTGDAPMQWQLLPTTLVDKKATFYYTSILGAGEVSKQLIDYVELDSSASQEMYKTFDYDLNITLDSAQVTYADDAATLRTAEAAEDAFSWKEIGDATKVHNITGHVQNPLQAPSGNDDNQTIVSWSDSAAIVSAVDGG